MIDPELQQRLEEEDAKRVQAQMDRGNALEQQQEQQNQVVQEQEETQAAERANLVNEKGEIKTQHELKDPSEFGVGENITDAGNAVVAGLQDAWNNTVDLGKYFDREFYQERSPGQDPYEFGAPFKFDDQPLVRTGWGKAIRGLTDIGIGFVGLGKIGMAVKGLRGATALSKGAQAAQSATKTSRALRLTKTLAKGGAKGAIVDAWDSDSQDANVARQLIEWNPDWADALEPIATQDYMSPAQKTLYNVAEGIALGGLIDVAMEGAGAGMRGLSQKRREAAKAAKAQANKARAKEGLKPIDEAYPTPMKSVELNSDLEYQGKGPIAADKAQKVYETNQFQVLKKNGLIDEDVTIDQWRQTTEIPSMEDIDTNVILKNGYSTPEMTEQLADKIGPRWDQLDDASKQMMVELEANKMDMDYGPVRDYERRGIKQGKQVEEIGIDQFSEDIEIGAPRQNPYYAEGAAAHENAPLSVEGDVMGAIRDQVTIRNDWSNKYGANRGVQTEAAIRRMANQSKVGTDEINKIAEGLVENESFKHLYGSTSRKQMQDDFVDATADLQSYLDITGNSHAADLTSENMMEFLYSITPKLEMDKIEGVAVLSHRQLVATDVMLGQLAEQIRDMSKAGLSVADQINVTSAGGLIDGITERYKALARLRARTSALSSYKLRQFRSPDAAPVKNLEQTLKEAEDAAAGRIDLLREVIQKDNDEGGLFEAFQYFTAASNGKLSTMKDMEEFFNRKLTGYRDGDVVQKNAIVGELMTMGINSMLSGPKTAVRATFGTGFNTFLRPVSAIVGATLGGDRRTIRESFAFLAGMWEAQGDAMRKAVADFKTYQSAEDPFRGFIQQQSDDAFDAMQSFYEVSGSAGEKAQMRLYGILRGLNKNPFLNYGPRIMKASDSFFGQIIGRGYQRVREFNKLYDATESSLKVVDDANLEQLGLDTDKALEKAIWTADGKLADEMANFTWDEAAMKRDLTGGMAKLDQAFDSLPALKPFVGLFMKTGVNAMELATKYTPGLNLILKENRDILTKAWNDPEMIKYGIKSPQDLATAKAVLKGRQAIATATVGLASAAYLNGDLTGNGPPDRRLRNAWLQAGWKPRSIRLGGVYVSYDSLEPFNTFLSFIADAGDASNAMGDEWTNNEFSKAMHLLSANVTNKTFLAGLMNLNDLLTSRGQRAGSVLANLANNQVPLSSLRNEIGKVLSPGMRELESGFLEGIRNRNLWTDVLTDNQDELPYRYDILNGTKLNDWDPMTRLFNAVSPFNINLAANQTRQLLFRSQINLAQQFNTGPNGEDLEGMTDLKSRFQFLLGEQNIEATLADLFQNPDIMKSILDMEADREAGRKYDTTGTLHGQKILGVIQTAKKQAWLRLMEEDTRAGALQEMQVLKGIEKKQRQGGNNTRANQINDLLSTPK